jgi:hypothetical protein
VWNIETFLDFPDTELHRFTPFLLVSGPFQAVEKKRLKRFIPFLETFHDTVETFHWLLLKR